VANNRYLFCAVFHEIDFFAWMNSALRSGDEKSGRLEVPQAKIQEAAEIVAWTVRNHTIPLRIDGGNQEHKHKQDQMCPRR